MQVLVVDRFDLQALARLKSESTLKVSATLDPKPDAKALADCEALVIRSRTKVDNDFLSCAPKLRAIVTATSGFDHIDLSATEARGITVMHTPNANAAAACEMTWALIFGLSRKLIDAHRAVKSGEWRRDALVGHQMSGRTLGIVGLGRIGTRVARAAQAFGMKTVAFDPYLDAEDFTRAQTERLSFDELLRLSDVVTFHVPGSAETQHMLNRNGLENMNRSAILISASRGSVVAERDLVHALDEKWIAGAGLDVFEREPLPRDSRLMTFQNVVLSPHLGAATFEAYAAASSEAAQKIVDFAKSGAVSDRLPPEAAWYRSGFAVSSS